MGVIQWYGGNTVVWPPRAKTAQTAKPRKLIQKEGKKTGFEPFSVRRLPPPPPSLPSLPPSLPSARSLLASERRAGDLDNIPVTIPQSTPSGSRMLQRPAARGPRPCIPPTGTRSTGFKLDLSRPGGSELRAADSMRNGLCDRTGLLPPTTLRSILILRLVAELSSPNSRTRRRAPKSSATSSALSTAGRHLMRSAEGC